MHLPAAGAAANQQPGVLPLEARLIAGSLFKSVGNPMYFMREALETPWHVSLCNQPMPKGGTPVLGTSTVYCTEVAPWQGTPAESPAAVCAD